MRTSDDFSQLTAISAQAAWRRWELIAVSVGVPVAVGLCINPVWWIPALWVVAALATWRVAREPAFRFTDFWRVPDRLRLGPELRRVLLRFGLSTVVVVAFTAKYMPEAFLAMPRTQPATWIALMLLYPILSVYPQEALYRRYFFVRARGVLTEGHWTVLASALSFGWMHVIFGNVCAVALTVVSGWFFADTYRRTGSLRLVCLEHALYGNLIFTLGLGDFFCHSRMVV